MNRPRVTHIRLSGGRLGAGPLRSSYVDLYQFLQLILAPSHLISTHVTSSLVLVDIIAFIDASTHSIYICYKHIDIHWYISQIMAILQSLPFR